MHFQANDEATWKTIDKNEQFPRMIGKKTATDERVKRVKVREREGLGVVCIVQLMQAMRPICSHVLTPITYNTNNNYNRDPQ